MSPLSNLPGPWRWEQRGDNWWRIHDRLNIEDGPHRAPPITEIVTLSYDDLMWLLNRTVLDGKAARNRHNRIMAAIQTGRTVLLIEDPDEFWIVVTALADYERVMAEHWPETAEGVMSRSERVAKVRSVRERLLALEDPDPIHQCPSCHTAYRGWPCPNADDDDICRTSPSPEES